MDWVRKTARHLRTVLHHRGLPRHDMEDVIQDAFLRMQVYCEEGGQVRNPEAFLVRTALNLTANARSRGRPHIPVEALGEDLERLLGVEPSPEEVLTAEQRLQEVYARLEAMSARSREIFLLHFIDEYTYPQIARQLGISVSAIEKHMARAMLNLTGQE